MPIVSVEISLAQRMVILDEVDDPDDPPPGLPTEWKSETYVATFQADDGLQSVSGQVQVVDADRRYCAVIVPIGPIADTNSGGTGVLARVLGFDRFLFGAEVLNPDVASSSECDPPGAGIKDVSIANPHPPLRIYWICGEPKDDVKKFPNPPAGWPAIW